MDLHPVDILIYVLNIAVLFILLRLILWRPVIRFLSARAERVQGELRDAEKTRADAQALKDEYSRNIGELESRGREIMRESQTKASEEAESIIGDARKESERLLHDARERIADEKERAVIAARNEVARLATDMAANILKREVSTDDNRHVVDDFFRESR